MFASSDYDSSESSYEQDQGGQNYRQDDVVQETCMRASEAVKEIPTEVRQDGVDEHAGGSEYASVGVIERENKDGEIQREVGVIDYDSVGVKDQLFGESTESNKNEKRLPDIDGLGDSDDEDHLESDGQLSDESLFMASDHGSQVCSSGEEDDDLDLDEADDSIVQDTLFKNSSIVYSRHAVEKTEIKAPVGVKEKVHMQHDHDRREGEGPSLLSDQDTHELDNREVKDSISCEVENKIIKDATVGPIMSEEKDGSSREVENTKIKDARGVVFSLVYRRFV
ncbi:hypothetical protein L2E82_25520 [Cichorium intybus]|uniref:Uncharacterized protein n=1 Tax=Cichorium intybus TaxID=13427 RepID=A0ACB9E3T7_CICIN|nr:hypothetical protein L2E82_25520 [Cichorium intybus]